MTNTETGRPANSVKERLRLPTFDWPFFILILLLLAIGLATLFSASYAKALQDEGNSYYFIKKQIGYAIFGVVGMLGLSFIPYKFYRPFIWPFYIVCVFLLILVYFVGVGTEKRWILIAGTQFQPSELAKVAVIFGMSDYISRNQSKMQKFRQGVVYPFVIFGLCAGLILFETHLSGAILVSLVGLVLIAVGGAKPLHWIGPCAIGAAGLTVVAFTVDYMRLRIQTWLNPEAFAQGDGYQILQSFYAIGSGGLFGLSYGKSRQKYLYLPEPQNDFVFSVFCEEMGFIFAVLILLIFALLIWRGLYIARHAPNRFSSLIVTGIISRIAFQVILNIAVVTGTIPVTGVSLPFFSYGGTALIMLLFELGIVLQISRYSYLDKSE